MVQPDPSLDDASADAITPERLGFAPRAAERPAWTKRVAHLDCTFRLLRTIPELLPTEALQREVFGVTDRDLISAGEQITVHDTGGDVIGAFRAASGAAEEMIAFCIGYGGYVDRTPTVVSDMLIVRADLRSGGLGGEMKKLQAAVALERGFEQIVWTVDPLRAPNARLNIEKLGAYADRYEIDRYGADFGTGLYGGLPTDRLHMTWPIATDPVRDRLLGRVAPLTTADIDELLHFDPDRPGAERVLVHLPDDIDLLLARDRNAAMRWRLTMRETLQLAFAAGYAITGFVRDTVPELGLSSYVLSQRGPEAR